MPLEMWSWHISILCFKLFLSHALCTDWLRIFEFYKSLRDKTFCRNCSLYDLKQQLWKENADHCSTKFVFRFFFLLSQRKIATPSISFPFFPRGHHTKLEVENFLKIFFFVYYVIVKGWSLYPKRAWFLEKNIACFDFSRTNTW